MRETRIEVTAEEYERWSDMPQSEWEREFVGKYVDDSWKFGYGFYGCRISGEPNIIIAAKGDTCD